MRGRMIPRAARLAWKEKDMDPPPDTLANSREHANTVGFCSTTTTCADDVAAVAAIKKASRADALQMSVRGCHPIMGAWMIWVVLRPCLAAE
eukprot:CAMPEP_0202919878 /NCGR_PEP_ID=MMETSP1392-20130828/76559_1 /ASSEMBLY_ACC=CAM_ASM_000868 /TAXON_ID=225041 /ORGANISM="Chlamydomonas chlamydogama, Strain SAG 11-48b" /LENGTH=91 /DNA_ID=CAMNT_0049613339 /DNA_START=902 /DNA_END=1177 /DNA_ORIENTATION=+